MEVRLDCMDFFMEDIVFDIVFIIGIGGNYVVV